jgi:hypothetical protein
VQQDEKILEKMTAAYEQTGKAQSEKIGPNLRRIIVRSPITKLAAAAIILLLLLFSVNILIKRSHTKINSSAQYVLRDNKHIIMEIDTSPRYILFDVQNNYLNLKEIMPCNILPVLPSQL